MENGSLALQYLLSGVTKGSIYAVVAIGFNLIYSATGVLNFAQGEFFHGHLRPLRGLRR